MKITLEEALQKSKKALKEVGLMMLLEFIGQ